MDWLQPSLILLTIPAIAWLWWVSHRSLHPMSPARRRALFVVRSLLVCLALLALAGPAWERATDRQAVIFILDHSQSQGEDGFRAAWEKVRTLAAKLPDETEIGYLTLGETTHVIQSPQRGATLPEFDEFTAPEDGGQSNPAGAIELARGLFPPGTLRRIVLVTDGMETRGDLESAARTAALRNIVIDTIPIAGKQEPDVRAVRLVSSKSRAHEGASLELTADIESSLSGKGRVRLFENGIEVESRELELNVGEKRTEVFQRTPEERNLYTYRVRVEDFNGDAIATNDEAMALVDVRGRPLFLYVEGEQGEAGYLSNAMAKEGIRIQTRSPETFPRSMQELSGYDGVIVSDVPAHQFSNQSMQLVQRYVEDFGGGFIMVGGKNSFGVGGYYRTPIEEVLPVKMKAPDKEERFSTALALVIDRSGSMQGQKIEICKSAAIATVELLDKKDYVGVVAFDSSARWIVPMTKVNSKSTINNQIATLNSGGGTNIHPGMTEAQKAMRQTKAKVKHMIVLSDGQSSGGGYEALAASLKAEGVTVSTVAVGSGAASDLLQKIATAGGGKFYQTLDPTNLPRIFTQDAMVHMGRLIREKNFAPKQVERHPMLKGIPVENAPQLFGYVKTIKKGTAQIPWVTDLGDPLLAHWQYGVGKVTAFTSDCKSRWAALWITSWPGYAQFWAQVLRETSRKPQGLNMDIQLEQTGEGTQIFVDLMEDAATFKNEAQVTADVYFVPAGSLGNTMRHLHELRLAQVGSGRYQAEFLPEEAGVYLVRARSGASMVSAGLVHDVSGESATGQVNETLLEKTARLTGGKLLGSSELELSADSVNHTQLEELLPWLVRIFLLLFLLDIGIRRWENIQGMWALLHGDRN